MWIWTCRHGFDKDLVEELRRAGVRGAREIAPALVASDTRPQRWPVFARAGFPAGEPVPFAVDAIAAGLAGALDRASASGGPRAGFAGRGGGAEGDARSIDAFGGKPRAWLLHAWVPDTDADNVRSAAVTAMGEAVVSALAAARPDLDARRVERPDETVRYGGLLAQVCVAGAQAWIGALPAQESPTLAPGGRARMGSPKDAPSRAARKLEEAFAWIGRAPDAGEVCVDLGAAPGGWTAVLLARRARVIAVDPAKLSPELPGKKGVVHVQRSAFDFLPDEPVDWLFCDMAWRPLEVAQLLAKWGRRKLAATLVANVKLPMKQRAEFVERVVKTVEEGGWRDVRARQLYHDREEITLAAWRV